MGARAAVALVLSSWIAVGCAAVGGSAGLTEVPTMGGSDAGRSQAAGRRRAWRLDVPTLLVDNRSGSQVAVYLDGMRIGTATAGRTCIRIPKTLGELGMVFAPTGSAGFPGPIAYLQESRHWRVELTPGVTIKYDVIGLTPSHESCAP